MVYLHALPRELQTRLGFSLVPQTFLKLPLLSLEADDLFTRSLPTRVENETSFIWYAICDHVARLSDKKEIPRLDLRILDVKVYKEDLVGFSLSLVLFQSRSNSRALYIQATFDSEHETFYLEFKSSNTFSVHPYFSRSCNTVDDCYRLLNFLYRATLEADEPTMMMMCDENKLAQSVACQHPFHDNHVGCIYSTDWFHCSVDCTSQREVLFSRVDRAYASFEIVLNSWGDRIPPRMPHPFCFVSARDSFAIRWILFLIHTFLCCGAVPGHLVVKV
jgi:hypothetical protein